MNRGKKNVRAVGLGLGLLCLSLTLAPARAGSAADCEARRLEVGKAAGAFMGEPRIKRLILADVARAARELDEDDVDECAEALDHAQQLLEGKY